MDVFLKFIQPLGPGQKITHTEDTMLHMEAIYLEAHSIFLFSPVFTFLWWVHLESIQESSLGLPTQDAWWRVGEMFTS